jgi:hypothetical protein
LGHNLADIGNGFGDRLFIQVARRRRSDVRVKLFLLCQDLVEFRPTFDVPIQRRGTDVGRNARSSRLLGEPFDLFALGKADSIMRG